MEKRWSKAEIAHLKRRAKSQSVEELARRFHTDVETVRRKLEELHLTPDSSSRSDVDAALEHYAEALSLLHGQKWAKAAELFESVAATTDSPQLADRARQNLEICRRQLDASSPDEEPYLQAVFEKNRGNLDAALELCLKPGKVKKDERYAYLAASIHALAGAEDDALKQLAAAIRLEPKNRIHAYHDPDFKALRGREKFAKLIAGGSS